MRDEDAQKKAPKDESFFVVQEEALCTIKFVNCKDDWSDVHDARKVAFFLVTVDLQYDCTMVIRARRRECGAWQNWTQAVIRPSPILPLHLSRLLHICFLLDLCFTITSGVVS